jgi:hypothetical protein
MFWQAIKALDSSPFHGFSPSHHPSITIYWLCVNLAGLRLIIANLLPQRALGLAGIELWSAMSSRASFVCKLLQANW